MRSGLSSGGAFPAAEPQLRAELDALERRYGVLSERRFEAFGDDDRCGDEELVRWSELYHIWCTSQRPTPTR